MKNFKIEELLTYMECNYLRGILLKEERKLQLEFDRLNKKGLNTKNVVSKMEELNNIYRKLDVHKSNNYNW
jgi:hypothetical protein